MHLYRILFIFLASTGTWGCKSQFSLPSKYEIKPALLHLSKVDQPDSIGFNLVTSFHKLLHKRIQNGDIALWKTSKKKILVNKTQFRSLEKLAKTNFINNNDFFIHEYWQLVGKEFNFSVQGFSFIGKSKIGKPISYGFIDAADVIGLLKNIKIPTTHHGPSDMSYWNAIHSKSFDFNLVQFGKKDFKSNPELSVLLKNQACYSKKVRRNFYIPDPSKRVGYKIIPPSINMNIENRNIYLEIENSLNDNKQVIHNINNEPIKPQDMFKSWTINTIRVTEKWTTFKNIPLQELENIQLEINGENYSLNNQQIEEMGLIINLQGISEYLSEKNFDFIIEKVNDENILPQNSEDMYQKLLQNI
jgi:hypothetical protein